MNVIAALILGFVIGWLVEWAVDWLFWRPKNDALAKELTAAQTQIQAYESGDGQVNAQASPLDSTSQQLESRNSDLEARVAGLETENVALLALVAELRTENEDLQSLMDTQVASLKDNFQEIYGVGPVIEGKLNDAGIYKFRQLADLDPDEFRLILGPETERPVNEEKIIALAALAARASENVRGDDLQAVRGVGSV
ncbi:MAG TPA: hypothetical protein VJ768_00495, partial [Anaerolineales bacterium]|nr:hypothetical protein [Anaerolineales bacterium]